MSIKTKIIVASTVVFGVMLCLLSFIIYQDVKEAEITKLDARLGSHADKVETELEEDLHQPTYPDAGQLHELKTEGLPEVRLQLIDRHGRRVIHDSLLSGTASTRWQEAFTGTSQKEIVQIGNHAYRCVWVRAEINGDFPYVIQLAAPMSDVEASLNYLRVLIVFSIPLVLLITALAAYFIIRIAFRPMVGMIGTARQISAENLHQRLRLPEAHDEVRLLAETLNAMIDRIDSAFKSHRQFIADASHELRTPLTVLCTELEYAERHTPDDAVRESIRTCLSEIDRLARLSDSLLLLAKIDASQLNLDLHSVRLDEVLLECVRRVHGIAEKKGVDIRVDVQEAFELNGDREKLESIVFNLLDNAVKYSRSDTVVKASLHGEDGGRNNVVLTVADEGLGIPASVLPNIFKRFYRGDPSRTDAQGNGLGLAIVERLVAMHGGRISVQSEEGKGSVFSVELPLKKAL